MTDHETIAVTCPTCSASMADGWIAMWNPIVGQKVRWQPDQPGYVRLSVPDRARVLLRARVGGRDSRRAWRCESCATTVVLRDESYDA